MKTAISLPDTLFEAAEQFAHQKGLSRSELYAKALHFYLNTQRRQQITEALNEVYATESSSLDPGLAAAQTRSLSKDTW